MKTFTDNAGRTWSVAVNVDAVRRVRALLGVDLMEVVEGKLLDRLAADPVLLCDLVYALSKPEADAAGVTAEDFGRSMAGDAIDAATTALTEELVDFFPSRRRLILAKAFGVGKRLADNLLADAEMRLDDPALEARLLTVLRTAPDGPALEAQMRAALKVSGGSSGNAPASPASPPVP